MKNNGLSLEEQRQALLEHIHSSRATYRRMLTGEEEQAEAVGALGSAQAESTAKPELPKEVVANDPAFPRSMTMRWIIDHPYYTAAAIVGVALLIPKAVRGTRRVARKAASKKQSKNAVPAYAANYVPPNNAPYTANQPPAGPYPQTIYVQQPSSQKSGALKGVAAFGGTALTSLVTIAGMVLRDPAKMQMAMKMYHTATDYLQKQRNSKGTQNTRTPQQ